MCSAHERISPGLPFKCNQKVVQFLILTLQCDAQCRAWLHSMMHTAELDSPLGCTLHTVWCTSWSLTPLKDENTGVWLCSLHPTEESYFIYSGQCQWSRWVRITKKEIKNLVTKVGSITLYVQYITLYEYVHCTCVHVYFILNPLLTNLVLDRFFWNL